MENAFFVRTDEPHLKVLTARTWDDGAQKFARKEIKKIRGA